MEPTQPMQGFLLLLEPVRGLASTLRHERRWTRRFLRLDAAARALDVFSDASQQERTGRLALAGAEVRTADELGLLLSPHSRRVDEENARRFVLRVTEHRGDVRRERHHFLSAERDAGDASDAAEDAHALVAASRACLDAWVHALQAVATPPRRPHDLRTLVDTFLDRLHVSARVSGRTTTQGVDRYELTVHAWALTRELAPEDDEDVGGRSGRGGAAWQVLEHSCVWTRSKSAAELRALDGHLRQLARVELRDVALAGDSLGDKLAHLVHASPAQQQAERQRRVQRFDAFLQALLGLPALWRVGSDVATVLDTFLALSPHLGGFRELEQRTGATLHLRERRVVPWTEREAFEADYQLHLDVLAAQRERERDELVPARVDAKGQRRHHERHHHHHSLGTSEEDDGGRVDVADVAPLPVAAPVDLAAEEARASEAVRARVARIGHQLLSEAFTAPSSARTSA